MQKRRLQRAHRTRITISSLPVELLTKIIKIVGQTDWDGAGPSVYHREIVESDSDYLLKCSLVSSLWASVALPCLYRHLVVRGDDEFQALNSSPAVGRYQTKTISIDDVQKDSEELIERLWGLKHMSLTGCGELSHWNFSSLDLAALETLCIISSEFSSNDPLSQQVPQRTIPFRLQKLITTPVNALAMAAIISASIQSSTSTITYLDLRPNELFDAIGVRIFDCIAPFLLTLVLSDAPQVEDSDNSNLYRAAITRLVTLSTSLTCLIVNKPLDEDAHPKSLSLFKAVSSPLRELHLGFDTCDMLNISVLETLEEAIQSLGDLEHVKLVFDELRIGEMAQVEGLTEF